MILFPLLTLCIYVAKTVMKEEDYFFIFLVVQIEV